MCIPNQRYSDIGPKTNKQISGKKLPTGEPIQFSSGYIATDIKRLAHYYGERAHACIMNSYISKISYGYP